MDMDFDLGLEKRRVHFRHAGKWYVLLEPSGYATALYQQERQKTAKVENGEVVDLGDYLLADFTLLGESVYKSDEKGQVQLAADGTPHHAFTVGREVVQHWPDRVTAPLLKKLEEWQARKEEGTTSPQEPSTGAQQEDKQEEAFDPNG